MNKNNIIYKQNIKQINKLKKTHRIINLKISPKMISYLKGGSFNKTEFQIIILLLKIITLISFNILINETNQQQQRREGLRMRIEKHTVGEDGRR